MDLIKTINYIQYIKKRERERFFIENNNNNNKLNIG